MISISKEGKNWLDKTFDTHDLHIKVEGGKCANNCVKCRCCKGQIQVVDAPADEGDITISAEGYNFSVNPDIDKKARILMLESTGGSALVTCARPIF